MAGDLGEFSAKSKQTNTQIAVFAPFQGVHLLLKLANRPIETAKITTKPED